MPKRNKAKKPQKLFAKVLTAGKPAGPAVRAGRNKKIPDHVLNSIPYVQMFKNGICHSGEQYYTKSIVFEDINYALLQEDEQARTRTRSWYCTAPSGTCDKTAIKDKTMKTLVAEVLSMEQFDETVMDSQIEYASVLKDIVTFHFRDGHTADRSFEDKRRGAKHTDDYKKYMSEIMKQKWRDRRGENSNDDSGDNQPVYSSVDK